MSESVFNAEVKVPGAEPLKPVDAAQFRNVVENRRSVRKYDGTPVPEAVMRDCLDLALLAPNSSNLQPWEFYWVRSPEKRAKLNEYCFGQNAARTAAEIVVFVGRIDKIHQRRKQMLKLLGNKAPKILTDYYAKLVPIAYGRGWFNVLVPLKWAIFTAAGFFRVGPREPLGSPGLRLWASKTTALAAENFMLAAASHGFDTCPMEGLDSKRVKKLLGLPASSVVVMAVSVGKRSENGIYGARIRFPKEEFLFEV
jgi:nitroreductase